jgi:hypothetical protein
MRKLGHHLKPKFETLKGFYGRGFRGNVLDNLPPKCPQGGPPLKRPQILLCTPLNTTSEMNIDIKLIICGYYAPPLYYTSN